MTLLNKIQPELVKRILIVEDDLIIAMINKKYCSMLGHTVVDSVRTGKDAIISVQKHNPDLILMDIKIDGELDGIQTMLEIRKFSDVDVIYITANSETSIKKRAKETKMRGFYVKPISLEELKFILEYKK